MKRFGVMLDMSRNAVMKVEQVKKFASILKLFGYNMIQLYTEDTYEVEGEPFFGYLRGRYSAAELQDIVSYCKEIDMEVIPCIQTLAHLNQIFRWREYKKINDCGDILLVEEERTYELIENMFRALRKSFTSEYVHIGMDEAHMLGLGKYLDKHGFSKRFDILNNHLNKVIEIAKKYGFKPLMWSDMFFRLANNGEYYPENPMFEEEYKAAIPQDVGLVYWDYYHTDKDYYEKMMRAHLQTNNEIWFAGGAWTWVGFASCNQFTLNSMLPAMESAKKCDIDNIFLTMWGDNGKECSFYSLLPSLYAVRRVYDGESDIQKIKEEFKSITGENFDDMMSLDMPNYISDDRNNRMNACKSMLYNDPFLGYFDATVKSSAKEYYEACAEKLSECAKNSKYAYLFENAAALCGCMAIKYDLGVRTRKAYRSGNKKELLLLIADYDRLLECVEVFYEKFQTLWYKENKPHGFDAQDIRFGGLKQRLLSCRTRLMSYYDGKIDSIPELEEDILDGRFGEKTGDNGEFLYNEWRKNVSINII